LKSTFSTSMLIFLILCAILLLLAECVGVRFLNTYLVIPTERLTAANWVFQLSILAGMNTLLVNPYNACIIAHEKMDVYAYVSIVDVVMKLLVACSLPLVPYDRLVVYGVLILVSQIIVSMIYRIYCIRHFEECHLEFQFDKQLFREILGFSGWNLFGAVSSLAKTQGLNLIINMFFSPAVNASRGIAVQINHAVVQFFSNFYTAFRPQITKYYAQGDIQNMMKLVCNSTRYSFYLIFLLTFPLILETPAIIQLWLGQIPEYSVSFTRLILLISAFDSLSNPLMTTAQAVGKLKAYQTTIGCIILLNIPLSYLALKNGMAPDIVFLISACISFVCILVRLAIVSRLIEFPVREYIINVYGRITLVSVIALAVPLLFHCLTNGTLLTSIVSCGICALSSLIAIYTVGINTEERLLVNKVIKKKILTKI